MTASYRVLARLALLALAAAVPALGPASGPALGEERAQTAQRVVELTNAYRAELGTDALSRSETLDAAAQDYAEWLAARGDEMESWGHRADGRDPGRRARAAGYAGCVGENLSYGKATGGLSRLGSLAEISMQGWKKSPQHDANLRRSTWRDIGVGRATGESGGWTHFIVVQMFGDGSGAGDCVSIGQ